MTVGGRAENRTITARPRVRLFSLPLMRRAQDEQVETEEGAQQDRERRFIRSLTESTKQRANHTHGQLLLGEPGRCGRK